MSLINCPSCNKRINDTENVCPNCGHILNKDISSLFWISVIAICAGVILIAVNLDNKTSTTGYSNASASYGSMDILEHKWCRDKWGDETICGIIQNNMGKMGKIAFDKETIAAARQRYKDKEAKRIEKNDGKRLKLYLFE